MWSCNELSTFDFTLCVRPDGTTYGSRGKCRKGREASKIAESLSPRKDKAKAKLERAIAKQEAHVGRLVSGQVSGTPDDLKRAKAALKKLQSAIKPAPEATPSLKGQKESGTLTASKKKKPPENPAAAQITKMSDDELWEGKASYKPGTAGHSAYKNEIDRRRDAKERLTRRAEKTEPKLSPEEQKSRKKYQEIDSELKRIEAIQSEVKKRIQQETGQEPYPGSKSYKQYQIALAERGVRDDASMKLRQKRDQYLTPSLKAEIQAAAIVKNEADWKAMSRDQKREILRRRLERFVSKNYNEKDIQSLIESYQGFIKSSPSAATPENRLELMAARAYRSRLSVKAREEQRSRADSMQENLRNSPKYKEVPGSSKPMVKLDSKKYQQELENEAKARERKAKELDEKGQHGAADNERWYATEARDRKRMLENGYTGNPPLSRIYESQGFNAKPEAVASRKDLEERKDLVTGDDGKTLILWRGVTTPEFADQFKGWGPNGEAHFTGQGIYGNGTYAASAAPGSKRPNGALDEAKSYSGASENYDRKVTAMGIRKDANIVQFEGEDWRSRDGLFRNWLRETMKEAEKATGYTFSDPGEAAAALGIHAYRVPQGRDEDFWVILNRGALVVAGDPQIDSYE